MGLSEYKKKRNFRQTTEPEAEKQQSGAELHFVIQRHRASRLHYDFRLEMDGVLKSWAVPKGPSLNPADKRLAMMVEDHPYNYRTFEGVIPEGNYGAGVVHIFDKGTYEAISGKSALEFKKDLRNGNLKFRLHGKKLKGEFALVKLKNAEENAWLLIKHRDEFAVDKAFNIENLVPESIKKQSRKHKKLAQIEMRKVNPGSDTFPPSGEWMCKPTSVGMDWEDDGGEWLFEPHLNGTRVLVHLDKSVQVMDEQQVDIADQHPTLSRVLKSLDVKGAVLDAVLIKQKSFEKLVVLDLLALAGHDVRNLELQKRKQLLKAFIEQTDHKRLVDVDFLVATKLNGPKLVVEKGWNKVIVKKLHNTYDVTNLTDWYSIDLPSETSSAPTENKPLHTDLAMSFPDEIEERFGKRKLKLTHLNKLYWPKEKISKGTLLDYYRNMSSRILPYLKDRPLSLNRHPNGIESPNFFQKDLNTDHIPEWIKSKPLYSESTQKDIDYLICNDQPTLLWMVNLGCIEINPWLSTYKKPDKPHFAVLDLDPNEVHDFKEVIKVALTAKEILQQMRIRPYIKTSGSRGLHIFIHVGAKYDYEIVKHFIHYLGKLILEQHPDTTSLERSPSKRKNKIYLDFLQNRRGQTIAAPYSVRPKPGATVSTPLHWNEVTDYLKVKSFTLFNTLDRIDKVGDLWEGLYQEKTDLKYALEQMARHSDRP